MMDSEYFQASTGGPEKWHAILGDRHPQAVEPTDLPRSAFFEYSKSSSMAMMDQKEVAAPSPQDGQKRILGLSVTTFWMVVALLMLLLSGTIGGSVAAGLVSQRAKCGVGEPTNQSAADAQRTTTGDPQQVTTATGAASPKPASTTQPTTTATGPRTGPSAVALDPGCPFIHGQRFWARDVTGKEFGDSFITMCGTNYASGARFGNPGTYDVLKLYAPDLPSCVAACQYYNIKYAENISKGIATAAGLCRSVALVLKEGEYCYLKNATGKSFTHGEDPRLYVSAVTTQG